MEGFREHGNKGAAFLDQLRNYQLFNYGPVSMSLS
jgi:hypothetical protein